MSFIRLKRSTLSKPVSVKLTTKETTKPKKDQIDPTTQGILSNPLPGHKRISYKTGGSLISKTGERIPVVVVPEAQNLAARRACHTAICWSPEVENQLDALSKVNDHITNDANNDHIEPDINENEYDPELDEDNF